MGMVNNMPCVPLLFVSQSARVDCGRAGAAGRNAESHLLAQPVPTGTELIEG
jgi:hypothetical protein